MPGKSSRQDITLLAGLFTVSALIYGRTLSNYLVADDWVLLEPRSFISTAGYFLHSVIPEEWEALWLRPLPMFTFWLDNLLWPGSTRGPHLFNVVLHLVNIALVGIAIRSMTARKNSGAVPDTCFFPVFAGCLVFALHPLGVGSVAWIAARFDILSVTFGLGAFIVWIRWHTGDGGNGTLALCLTLLAASLFSKEQGIVFLAAITLSAFYTAYTNPQNRRRNLTPAISIAIITILYFAYRITIFHGIGGYLFARRALNFLIPLDYFLAILYPWGNIAPEWRGTMFLFAAIMLFVVMTIILYTTPFRKCQKPDTIHGIAAVLLCFFGLLTTAPNSTMRMRDILGHSESRFVLISLAGLAMGIGYLFAAHIRTIKARRIAVIVLGIWGITALWRIDVQIAAWHAAGETARGIVETTRREAPEPAPGSAFYYLDIPGFSDQFAYIFGIGLEEAITRQYPGRDDIMVHRNPPQDEFLKARPDVDHVFRFDSDRGILEPLYPQLREGEPE